VKNKITEILGWYGVVAILLAYALLNFDILSNKSLTYQLLNLTGAIGIVIDALDDKNYQPMVLNIVWALVAVFSLAHFFL
jgi:hypothetical protein